MMQKSQVFAVLESIRDERGILHWQNLGAANGALQSYGVGLTKLRKLARQIGRDHELAQELWQSDVYEARVISLLIDDPSKVSREQAEQQVTQLGAGALSHVFSSCDATLAKTPFVLELADVWTRSDDDTRRSCGYGLLYEASKFSGRKAPSEDYFLDHVEHIAEVIHTEKSSSVRLAMGCALMGIGKRSSRLNEAALKVARAIGPISFSSDNCDPFDVERHLTTDRLRTKLGIQ